MTVKNRHMDKTFESVVEIQDEERSSRDRTAKDTPEEQSENDFRIEITSNQDINMVRNSGGSNVTNKIMTNSMLHRVDLNK